MKKVLLVTIILFESICLFAQHEKYKPIETDDLQKYFSVHDSEEGPGVDYFGILPLRLHLANRVEPLPLAKLDKEILPSILQATSSRFGVNYHNNKFYFEFPSNAPWEKENAALTLFINDGLISDYNKEIAGQDEVWLFFIITSYDTFKMEGYGRIVDFLNRESMQKKNLLNIEN